MNVISLQHQVQVKFEKQEKINELVAKCITQACAATEDLRLVLRGDMQSAACKTELGKAS
ncbi:hypothetical protein [Acinetobacter sp. YH12116]|uniref:hypothetical protein n=1 Tax=Acinetobacter sp. YH12116 TaxID=2601103 RepID=UPI0015D38361|nr:hypothetical protein [Acinetobacter sp. YH12116]